MASFVPGATRAAGIELFGALEVVCGYARGQAQVGAVEGGYHLAFLHRVAFPRAVALYHARTAGRKVRLGGFYGAGVAESPPAARLHQQDGCDNGDKDKRYYFLFHTSSRSR